MATLSPTPLCYGCRKIDGYSSLIKAAIPDLRANLSQANWSSAPKTMPAGMPKCGARPATVVTRSLIVRPVVVCTPNPSFALKLAIRSRISASSSLSTSDNHARNSRASGSLRTLKTCSMSIRESGENSGSPARATTLRNRSSFVVTPKPVPRRSACPETEEVPQP
jgi:hypothetical protein